MMMRRSHRESRQPEDEGRTKSKMHHQDASTPAAMPVQLSPLSPFPKTRCYRLNLEKPLDISAIASCSSPLYRNRDYSGPITEADLPPVQGPAEYYPPPHLCRSDELRRHYSWSSGHHQNSSLALDLMANLQVSESSDSQNETSVAISTARIFRGITVDRNGVILTQNARAMRSRKTGDKNKLGEKSRQAAKIDKAKDLIDEVLEAGASGGVDGNDENDPSKIVSLYVMGEYDELNDLVRDGSKKLRESKSLSDEAILMYNRPRPIPPYITSPSNHSIMTNTQYRHSGSIKTSSNGNINQDPTMASPSNRKRVLGSRYKNVPRSAPPKLKSHPRDNRPSIRTRKSSTETMSSSDKTSSSHQQPHHHHQQSHTHHPHHNHYFREQCNFFPGPHSNWAEAFGFSVNSLWNCGANNGHMSPTSHSVSPRSHASGGMNSVGGYSGDPHSGSNAYSNANGFHGNNAAGGYHHYGYEEGRDPSSSGHGGTGVGSGHYEDGYGRSRNGGVRDTIVM